MAVNRKLTILHGSQTGTAQDLAEQIWRESKRYHFIGSVMPMDSYDIQSLIHEHYVVFVCATTGDGEEPDNMKSFWKFLLRKSLPTNSLERLSFAVLGLGDSSYNKFNYVAKRLSKRLQQLGGTMFIPTGLADDQHDLGAGAVSLPWISDLWVSLLRLCPLPSGLAILADSPRQFRWSVQIAEGVDVDEDIDIYGRCSDAVFDKPFSAILVKNDRITAENHFQDVRLLSFSCLNVEWAPGDVFVVRPQNCTERVAELFALFAEHDLSFGANTVVRLQEFDSEMPVPQHLQGPLSLRTVATQYWDLNALPRPRTFELLAINCKNALEKEKLFEFTTAEGQEDLYSYANRPRRTVLETLVDFPHSTSQLTLAVLFELFQPIKTRSFSIASCHQSGTLDLLVAVVTYKTIISRPRTGLCSNWLKHLSIGSRVRGTIQKGTFKFPQDPSVPLIMVGPGTGLAPFRSLLLEREWRWHQEGSVTPVQTLFFGCRQEKADFHCRADLRRMENEKLLTLFTAFSRDQADKIYVQHRIEQQNGHLKSRIIDKNGFFFVAGSSKDMPAAVKEALASALGDVEYVERMIQSGRYQEETWA